MGSHNGAEAVVRVGDTGCPLPERLAHSVLQCGGSGGHRNHLRAQQAHTIDVQRLADRVLFAHKHNTFHVHERRGCGCRDAVLSRAGLGDEPGLPHFLRQKRLTQHIVDLVRPCVVQILALQIDFCPAQSLRQPPGIVETRRPPRVLVQQLAQLCVEARILLIEVVGLLQFDHRVHQGLGDILSAVNAESSCRIFHSSAPFPPE